MDKSLQSVSVVPLDLLTAREISIRLRTHHSLLIRFPKHLSNVDGFRWVFFRKLIKVYVNRNNEFRKTITAASMTCAVVEIRNCLLETIHVYPCSGRLLRQ